MAKINVRVDVGQGEMTRFVNKTIDVSDNFRFLNNHSLDQNQFEQLQGMPESNRGMAIVGQRSIQNPGGTMQSAATDYSLFLRSQGVNPQNFSQAAKEEYDKRIFAGNTGKFIPLRPAFHQADVDAKRLEAEGQRGIMGVAANAIPFGLGVGAAFGIGKLVQFGGGLAAKGLARIGVGETARTIMGRTLGAGMTGAWGYGMYQQGGPLARIRQGDFGFMSGLEAAGDITGIGAIGRGALGVGRGVLNQFALNSPLRMWMRGNVMLPNEIIPAPKNRFSGTSEAYSDWMASQSPKGPRYKPTYQTGIGYKGPSNISESVGAGGPPLGSGGPEAEAAKTAEIIKKQFGIDITKILGGKGFLPGEPYPFGDIDKSIKIKPTTNGFFSSLDPFNIYLRKSGIGPQTAAHETGHLLDYLTNTVESILSGKGLAFGYKKGQGQSIYKSDQPGSLFNILSQKALTPQVIARLDLSGYKQSKYAAEGFARGFADVLGGAASPDVKKAAEAAMQHAKSILGKVGMTEDVGAIPKQQHEEIIDNIEKIIGATSDPATKAKLEQHLKDVQEVFAGQMTSPVPPAPQPQKIPQPQQGGPKPFADPKDFGQVPEVPPGLGELVPVQPAPFPNPAIKPANGIPNQGVVPVQPPEPNIGPIIQGGAAPNPVQPVPMPELPMPGPDGQPVPRPAEIPAPVEAPKPAPVDVQQPKPAEVPEPQPQPQPQPVQPAKPAPVKVKDKEPVIPPVARPRFGDSQQEDYGFLEMGGFWLPAAPSVHTGQWATPAYIIDSGRLEYNVD
jgi:hypothetical protein